MSITISDELAKRVLEALDERCERAREEVQGATEILGWDHSGTARAVRSSLAARDLRDELAALLTPKEAT